MSDDIASFLGTNDEADVYAAVSKGGGSSPGSFYVGEDFKDGHTQTDHVDQAWVAVDGKSAEEESIRKIEEVAVAV